MTLQETINYGINSFKSNQKLFNCDDFIGSFFLAINKFKSEKGNIFLLTKNNYQASKLYNALSVYLGADNVILMPCDELIRVEYISTSKEMVSNEIMALYEISQANHKVIISSVQATFRFYPDVNTFKTSFIILKKGEKVNIENLKRKLIDIGYYKVTKIDQTLQFATRGDIIDIFSLNFDNPVRIEFFDDEIESIRTFRIDTQTSVEQLSEVLILPASINLLSPIDLESAEEKLRKQAEIDKEYFESNELKNEFLANINQQIDEIHQKDFGNKFYKNMSFLQGFHTNLLGFLNNYILINCGKNDVENKKQNIVEESKQFLIEMFSIGKCLSTCKYFSLDNMKINTQQVFNVDSLLSDREIIKSDIKEPIVSTNRQSVSNNIFNFYLNQGYKIIISLNDNIYILKTEELLKSLNVPFSYDESDNNIVHLIKSDFPLGFEISSKKVVILTEKEIYGVKRHNSTYKNSFKQGTIINSYEELSPGDYVVHENYGIGEYIGIQTIELHDIHQDYLEIHYSGDEKLFVPLYQFNLIRKYASKDGRKPKISKLSTNQREKTKKKIKERVNVLADRLLTLYQERSQLPGYAFAKDDELQQQFENEFPYELTKDQASAITEIKKDMEKPTPMDRLLCGDVGFGKTEVALRAAFKALNSGKQVALLCPTTLLAKQHYDLVKNRFKNFDFGIALSSRLQTNGENKNIFEKVAKGEINFLIGTHKILNKNLVFKDLGLLIIDEEQRFGVEQKEKIKERMSNIDVLTLSATPIPRTLQSTLVGLKTTSSITTPPKERMPIQTYVIPFDNSVIKEVIMKEISRQGQVFFVHNEIASIYERAAEISSLVPECSVGIIHAKMDKEVIENTMLDFYEGKIDILFATSIIENGIDVRNANLMIVDNADHFGLAQLYQIKGRVGRGDRMAYAYLLVDTQKALNEEASKRIKAITDFTELGSGLKISQRDLLIRGAGDILGPEQAGFIDSIGVDMYIKILNEVVEEKRGTISAKGKEIFSDLSLDSYIPSSFTDDESKLQIYQEILDTQSLQELNAERDKLIDMYGKLPNSLENLFIKHKIKLYLMHEAFDDFKEFELNYTLVLSKEYSSIEGIGTTTFTSLIPFLKNIKITYIDKKINIYIHKADESVSLLLKILNIIDDIYNKEKKINEIR
ncbi:MAG: transcription-repair coupling factor [Candidatus Onthovivens sp.]|nr:transcription-repair coupling factor [Candidatus Onthovivens sp.]